LRLSILRRFVDGLFGELFEVGAFDEKHQTPDVDSPWDVTIAHFGSSERSAFNKQIRKKKTLPQNSNRTSYEHMGGVAQHLALSLPNALKRRRQSSFLTGLDPIDGLLPSHGFTMGAIHEVLVDSSHYSSLPFLILLARSATPSSKSIACLDLRSELYPPGLATAGLPIKRLLILRPEPAEAIRVVAECCRCKGIGATIASLQRLTQVEARRLQLATERGGGIGLIVRNKKSATYYAASTRWIVTSLRGDKSTRRWNVQLIHGHGGRIGQSAIFEVCRETNRMRAFESVACRSVASETISVPA
jgi:hypothetical protein